ncbi:hypothetical protein PSPO01_14861 [Paraphaeosphaeria sporulosa]
MLFFIAFTISLSIVHGHSWVERVYVVKEGVLVGKPGFPRGYVQRTPTFTDQDMTYLLPPAGRMENKILPSDLACKETQRNKNYTVHSPMLVVRPNDHIRLLYQENGHVTRIKDDPNRKGTSGTVTVVGTRHGTSTDTLQDILDSNSARHHATTHISNFDDGVCYQANGTPEALKRQRQSQRPRLEVEGPDLWCGQDFLVPGSLKARDVYTMYWIWNFDGFASTERYTTCLDVLVSD